MRIQECTIKDIFEIKTLFKSVFTSKPWNDDWSDEDQLNAYLLDLMGQKNSLTFGLFDQNKLIGLSLGHIKHWYEGIEYYMDELCISTQEQGKGKGTLFLELLEIELYKRNIQHFFLLTDKDVPAYSFYKKLGFNELENNVAFTKKVDPFVFEKASKKDVSSVFQLIQDRMKWMDQKGIQQWNVMAYDEVYPMTYYEEMCEKGLLYVLRKKEEIVAAAVLKEEDERWKDNAPSLYVHNFVSKPSQQPYGKIFLKEAKKQAKKWQKSYLRLDSAVDNKALAMYYTKLGFQTVGSCEDGPYQGILRQKRIIK